MAKKKSKPDPEQDERARRIERLRAALAEALTKLQSRADNK